MKVQALGRSLFAAVFFTLLIANGGATLLGIEYRQDFDENRTLAPAPRWSGDLAAYIRGLDAYVNDHFAFRKPLLLEYSHALYHWLGSSLTSKVIVGSGDWLFGASFDGPQVSQNSLPESYHRAARLSFLERRDWLKERGVHLSLMFFPVKDVVYSQHLPRYLRGVSAQPSRSESLYNHMGPGLADNIVPLRQELKAVADAGEWEVYYRGDSHANHLGAFVAYQAFAKSLEKLAARGVYPASGAPRPYPEFELKPDRHYPSDYSRLIGVPREEFSLVPLPKPAGFTFHEVKPTPAAAALLPKTARPRFMANAAGRGKVVVLGDSFTTRLAAYFGDNFAESVVVNMNRVATNEDQAFPAKFIDAVRPDVVVLSYVEMRLGPCEGGCSDVVPTANDPDVRQARLRRLFEQARESKVVPASSATPQTVTLARFANNGAGPATVRVAPAASGPLEGEANEAIIPAGGSAFLFLTAKPTVEGAAPGAVTTETVPVPVGALAL